MLKKYMTQSAVNTLASIGKASEISIENRFQSLMDERKRYFGEDYCLTYRLNREFVNSEKGVERPSFSISVTLTGMGDDEIETIDDVYQSEEDAVKLFDALSENCVMPYVLKEIFEEYEAAR